jgi:hypothetical protein
MAAGKRPLPFFLLLQLWNCRAAAASVAAPAGPRVMASLPPHAVPGVAVELTVTEDLTSPGAPIVFSSASSGVELYRVTKNEAVPQVSNASWGGNLSPAVGVNRVLAESSDLLGNAMLKGRVADSRSGYATIAGLAPPLLANTQRADDYELTQGTFIGNRVSAQKHSFDHTGSMNNLDIKQSYHLDTKQLSINNTYIGLLGGFTPGTRWFWPLGKSKGYVEQIAFVPGESTDDQPFTSDTPAPIWHRYVNVTHDGKLLVEHYVDTYETYPYYCRGPSSVPKENSTSWQPSQFECNGENAASFYAALLSHSLFWNRTFSDEKALEIRVPAHGIDTGNFAKHAVAKIMITRTVSES